MLAVWRTLRSLLEVAVAQGDRASVRDLLVSDDDVGAFAGLTAMQVRGRLSQASLVHVGMPVTPADIALLESAELLVGTEVGRSASAGKIWIPGLKATPTRTRAKKNTGAMKKEPPAPASKLPRPFVPNKDTVYDPKCRLCEKHQRDCYGEIKEGIVGTCKWCMLKKSGCSVYTGLPVSYLASRSPL
jgi:hypothetical protein